LPRPIHTQHEKIKTAATVALIIAIVSTTILPIHMKGYSTDYVTLIVWTEGGYLYGQGPSQFWNITAVKDSYIYSTNGLVQNLSGKDLHLVDVRDVIVANPYWSAADLSNNLTSLLANLPGQSVLIVIAHGTPYAFHPYKYDGLFYSGEYVPIPLTWANSWHNTLVWANQVNQTTANKNIYELPSVVILGFCNSLGNTRSFDNLTDPSPDSWIYAYKFLINRSPYYVYGRAIVGFLTHVDVTYSKLSSGEIVAASPGIEFLSRFAYLYLIEGLRLDKAFVSALEWASYDGYASYLLSLYYGTTTNVTYTYPNPIPAFDDDAAGVIGYYASYADPTPKDAIVPKVLDELRQVSPLIYDKLVGSGVSPDLIPMGKQFDLISPTGRVLHAYDLYWRSSNGSPFDVVAGVYVSDDFSEVYLVFLDATFDDRSAVPSINSLKKEFDTAVSHSIDRMVELGLSYKITQNDDGRIRYAAYYASYPVLLPSVSGSLTYPRPVEAGYQLIVDSSGVLWGISYINTASMLKGITTLKALNAEVNKDQVIKEMGLHTNALIKEEWLLINATLYPIYVIEDHDKLFVVDAVTGKLMLNATMSSLGGGEVVSPSPSDSGVPSLSDAAPYLVAAVAAILFLFLALRRRR